MRQVVREGDYKPGDEADLAAAFQAAVIASLRDRTKTAMAMFRADFPDASKPALVVAGGVASNGAIRSALGALCTAEWVRHKNTPAPALYGQCRHDCLGRGRAWPAGPL